MANERFRAGGEVEDSLRVFVCTSGAVALFFVEDGLLPFKAMCPLWFTLTRWVPLGDRRREGHLYFVSRVVGFRIE